MLPSLPTTVNYPNPYPNQRDPSVILGAVRRELADSPYGCLKRLHCEWQATSLRVTGSVPTYYLKQVAQSSIRRVAQDCDLDNRIEVIDGAASSEAAARRSSRTAAEEGE